MTRLNPAAGAFDCSHRFHPPYGECSINHVGDKPAPTYYVTLVGDAADLLEGVDWLLAHLAWGLPTPQHGDEASTLEWVGCMAHQMGGFFRGVILDVPVFGGCPTPQENGRPNYPDTGVPAPPKPTGLSDLPSVGYEYPPHCEGSGDPYYHRGVCTCPIPPQVGFPRCPLHGGFCHPSCVNEIEGGATPPLGPVDKCPHYKGGDDPSEDVVLADFLHPAEGGSDSSPSIGCLSTIVRGGIIHPPSEGAPE